MFDVELITQLVNLMVEKDLQEIDLRDGDSKISLRRGGAGEVVHMVPAPAASAASATPVAPAAPGASPTSGPAAAPAVAGTGADEGLVTITSPMVGTYYASSDPESPPFVSVGGSVGPDSVVCIIEAMKVFNEIKAETTGTIERILVQNEHPVEFGQPLFMVRPS